MILTAFKARELTDEAKKIASEEKEQNLQERLGFISNLIETAARSGDFKIDYEYPLNEDEEKVLSGFGYNVERYNNSAIISW